MSKKTKREIDVLIISDVHLGTYGCRAKELLQYLKSVKVKTLILNGDIIDIWQFSKSYFPKSHFKVMKHLTKMLTEGTEVIYVTGNHDEMLRKFEGIELGALKIVNKYMLHIDGKKAWIFHGDVFDVTMQHSKWLAKLGGKGYDLLILLNTIVNWFGSKLGRGRISFSKKVKNSVKGAVKHINNFEQTAAEIAISNQYDYVICGHIHQPAHRFIKGNNGGEVMYLNSGDWVENLTSLEYANGEWTIYNYLDDAALHSNTDEELPDSNEPINRKYTEILNDLVQEFQVVPFEKMINKN
ncbi:UDP-2,3-diacylglucosamine diphosphatase [bacterium]|nr:UDP-2,3-diacylglucosamine diphosphatase [bacterium]